MIDPQYALSVKQPWATLLVHGKKSIEIRSWATKRRGRILIHAAKVPDNRPEAWSHVPSSLRGTAELTGGIIGSIEIADCIAYADLQRFEADQKRHLNDLSWFRDEGLFGFVMAKPRLLPFQPYPGWVRFFRVRNSSD